MNNYREPRHSRQIQTGHSNVPAAPLGEKVMRLRARPSEYGTQGLTHLGWRPDAVQLTRRRLSEAIQRHHVTQRASHH